MFLFIVVECHRRKGNERNKIGQKEGRKIENQLCQFSIREKFMSKLSEPLFQGIVLNLHSIVIMMIGLKYTFREC